MLAKQPAFAVESTARLKTLAEAQQVVVVAAVAETAVADSIVVVVVDHTEDPSQDEHASNHPFLLWRLVDPAACSPAADNVVVVDIVAVAVVGKDDVDGALDSRPPEQEVVEEETETETAKMS